jgi:integrase
MEEFVMGSINVKRGKLQLDFYYRKTRCREQTLLTDTPPNRKKLQQLLRKIEAEITLGEFDYAKYFPKSPRAEKFKQIDHKERRASGQATPFFKDFMMEWFEEMRISWRDSYEQTVIKILQARLKDYFGDKEVSEITKADLLQFRARLGEEDGRNGKKMSAAHINRHMYIMRMILREAADRFDFNTPFREIKALKNNKPDIYPFNLDEVNLIINNVDPWYRYYYTVRFLTGMRTGEIDGLKWKFIDFDSRLIKVRESLVKNKQTYTKNDFSQRDIEMSSTVYEALKEQHKRSGHLEYVFVNARGNHLNYHNISRRVWHPLLKQLGLERRNPYQTRHTAATLWLAAGENPSWIAKQMGHSTTEMLFRVYARFVPNLTRKDGSAMESLLSKSINLEPESSAESLDVGMDAGESGEAESQDYWDQFLTESFGQEEERV